MENKVFLKKEMQINKCIFTKYLLFACILVYKINIFSFTISEFSGIYETSAQQSAAVFTTMDVNNYCEFDIEDAEEE